MEREVFAHTLQGIDSVCQEQEHCQQHHSLEFRGNVDAT
jgi:hypothetical protein